MIVISRELGGQIVQRTKLKAVQINNRSCSIPLASSLASRRTPVVAVFSVNLSDIQSELWTSSVYGCCAPAPSPN